MSAADDYEARVRAGLPITAADMRRWIGDADPADFDQHPWIVQARHAVAALAARDGADAPVLPADGPNPSPHQGSTSRAASGVPAAAPTPPPSVGGDPRHEEN